MKVHVSGGETPPYPLDMSLCLERALRWGAQWLNGTACAILFPRDVSLSALQLLNEYTARDEDVSQGVMMYGTFWRGKNAVGSRVYG